MTEAEAKLIDAVLEWSAAQGPYGPFNAAAETVRAERSRHPYGSIAESMMVDQRNPDRYRFPDHVDSHGVGHYARDVCDPAPMQVSTSSISRITLTDRYDVREPYQSQTLLDPRTGNNVPKTYNIAQTRLCRP